MHCPRCGQQQVSEELKFCSRCGFPLGLVAEVLSHGGFLPQLADLSKDKKWLTRKNGVMLSIFWFMFFLLILAPLWGIADVEEMAGVSAIIGIFGGLMMLIASLVFLKPAAKVYSSVPNELQNPNVQHLYGTQQHAALPPPSYQPVDTYVPAPGSWRAPNTGELVQPGSVTDATTKLLKKDE